MIRLFTALCKAYFKKLQSERQTFQDATDGFSHLGEACPNCGAVGKLSGHGSYGRGLTSWEGGEIVDERVAPLRFLCESCGVTHALLPDIIVPHSTYSLLFMLSALIAYFERAATAVEICAQFGIAVSTMYEWKKRIAEHKDLMLEALISQKVPALAFLRGFLGSGRPSRTLRGFFRKHGFSFMQNHRSKSATRSRPP